MPRVFLPAILTGVLLWTAFFPLDLGALGFVALVPWLMLVRAPVSRRRRYLAAYTGGFVFTVLATNWVRVAHPMMYLSWLAFSLVLPLFWVLALDLIRRLDRLGVPLALAVPVVWVSLEYMRMHFPTGYPFLKPLGLYQMVGFGWYFLGYTQHAFLPLIQIADLGGVYAVSFIVAAVNGAVADWALRSMRVREWLHWKSGADPVSGKLGGGWGRPAIASLAVLALTGASVAYGYSRLQHPEFTPGPRVAAIQGSVPQDEKNAKGVSLGQTYGLLYQIALDSEPRLDLAVWPETCYPADWVEVAPGELPSKEFADMAAEAWQEFRSRRPRVPTLLGLNGLVWEDGRAWKYNSAVLLSPRDPFSTRYDKMHLVPFGEYVPFGETLPFMRWFTPYEGDYSCRPGTHWTRFPLSTADGRAFTFACLICYEDSDPYLARQYVTGDPVNFFVNISNDGWFDGTEEHEQHLAICRFRAIEARRSIVRSVNMGISAVIDADGRITELPKKVDEHGRPTIPCNSWSGSKKVEGVVAATISIDTRQSLYARLGDWVAAVCWAGVLLGVVGAAMRRSVSWTRT